MFWDNLTQICNERGTTPTKLLRKMGYSTSKADLWKNGSLPKQEMLRELADELHCSVADFFDDEVHLFYKSEQEWAEDRLYAQIKKYSEGEGISDEEKELLEAYNNADRKTQLKIMYYVISLKDIEDD